MPTPKLIRMGIMGRPKTFKTGGIVGSYPKPMLVIMGDPGGLSTIPSKPSTNINFKLDVVESDITWVSETQLIAIIRGTAPIPSKVTAINFAPNQGKTGLDENYQPLANAIDFPLANRICNALFLNPVLPWKTVFFDPVTVLSDIIYAHLAATQPAKLTNAKLWAPSIGLKVAQYVTRLTTLPCHVIMSFHINSAEKDELTGEVKMEPAVYSKYRDLVAGAFEQFVCSDFKLGKPVVYVQDTGFIKGIGCRWPLDLPNPSPNTFDAVFGSAVKNGEVVV